MMMADDPRKQDEVTPEGTVEINEQDLDQAAGGATFLKYTSRDLDLSPTTTETQTILGDGSVKPTYDLNVTKKI
jgi:hypothetical protein